MATIQTSFDKVREDIVNCKEYVDNNFLPSTATTANDATIKIEKNSTQVGSFTTNQGGAEVSINITMAKSDVGLGNVDNTSDASKPVSTATQTALNAKATSADLSTLSGRVTTVEGKIPAAATTSNQLADKAFVNSSIQNLAANGVGFNAAGDPFPTKAALVNATTFFWNGAAYNPSQNDYAVVLADESAPAPFTGGQVRYRYSGTAWAYEYGINESPFTAAQNNAINSGITSTLVTKLNGIDTGAQVNVIEAIKLNSTALTITGKAVNISVPTQASDISAAPASHVGAGGVSQHPLGNGTTPGFSTSDYTSAEKTKLAGIAAEANKYTHPTGSGNSKSSDFYKFSTDSLSHVNSVTAVTLADLTALGAAADSVTYVSVFS
jgi:hypothetical protein